MFVPSSETQLSGWHVLDPEGKRVMSPDIKQKKDKDDKSTTTTTTEKAEETTTEGEHGGIRVFNRSYP